MKIKICGIRNIEIAFTAVESGVDYLGFNFVSTSKRFIKPELAKKIIDQIKNKTKIAGVFQNASLNDVNNISDLLKLDYVQLHGEETLEYCKSLRTKIIKAFKLDNDFDYEKTVKLMKSYQADFYLIDRKVQGQGEMIDLSKVGKLCKIFPIFFSGGLNQENVRDIIKKVKPYGVDVASGIETDGQEDADKIKEFVKAVKSCNYVIDK